MTSHPTAPPPGVDPDDIATRTGAPSSRRGPLRPSRLVTARERVGGRLAVLVFRLVDVLAIAIVTVALVGTDAAGAVLDSPLSFVAPLALAGLVTARLLRSALLYRFGRHEPFVWHVTRLAGMVGAGALAGLALAAVLGDGPGLATFVRWSVVSLVALGVLHTTWWLLIRQWRRNGRLTPNIVIVGATRHAEEIVRSALARHSVNVLGVFDDRLARSPTDVAGVPVLGDTAALVAHRITPYVDLIVIAVDPAARARVRDIVDRLAALPNEVTLLIDEDGGARSATLERLADARLTRLDVVVDPDRRALAKRLQDVVVSAIGLVVLSPLLAAIALAVRLDSPGPVFFRQRRHGFNNEELVVWKFRTMRHEAADQRAERQVTANDDRVTRVGRILRTTSLDELPQLLNVLGGTMSLVGPRPHAIGMKTGEEQSAVLVADYARRHRIKPGMTGWAAIHGSRGPLHTVADVRRRVALDVEYIERQSFWLDVWIIVMTVPSVLGDRSAIR